MAIPSVRSAIAYEGQPRCFDRGILFGGKMFDHLVCGFLGLSLLFAGGMSPVNALTVQEDGKAWVSATSADRLRIATNVAAALQKNGFLVGKSRAWVRDYLTGCANAFYKAPSVRHEAIADVLTLCALIYKE